jgi:hypothetical protein
VELSCAHLFAVTAGSIQAEVELKQQLNKKLLETDQIIPRMMVCEAAIAIID